VSAAPRDLVLEHPDAPEAAVAREIERLRSGHEQPQHVAVWRRALADLIERAHQAWRTRGLRRASR
jgi:hypothetical protein